MRILSLNSTPIHEIAYQRCRSGGALETAQLPICAGEIRGLPDNLDAIICTSDLQGVELLWQAERQPRLLGEIVADELSVLLEVINLSSPERSGVILAGDLYSSAFANQRGISGDVRSVWQVFSRQFRWVAGVAGSHDHFGTLGEFSEFRKNERVHYLDGTTSKIDDLKIAGVSGIIGNPTKPMRRSAPQYAQCLATLAHTKPDLLVLHESPDIPEQAYIGSEFTHMQLSKQTFPLIVCGHVYWPQTLVEFSKSTQILNVDSRVVILHRPLT